MATRYAELRCKSCFSFLEGASQPEELVAAEVARGLDALLARDGFSNVAQAVGSGQGEWL